jgi:flagellar export protein FliJ
MPSLADVTHRSLASQLRHDLALYNNNLDLINIGAYEKGSNPQIDTAMQNHPHIIEFLKQDVNETLTMEQTLDQLAANLYCRRRTMNKFKFALDNILKYRQSIEDQEKERLARAIQKVQMEENMVRKLDSEKRSQLRSFENQTANIAAMRQQESYLISLDERIKRQQKKLEQAIKVSDNIRSRVVTATSNRKILDSLKEKHLTEYRQELARAEQNMLDEVGIASYIRKDKW